MLRLPIIELFSRGIPEAFLFMFASYALSKRVVDRKRLIISSILQSILVYLIRMLPISFGIHTILMISTFIGLTTSINKLHITQSISAAVIAAVLMFASEGVNILLIQNVIGMDINLIFERPLLKSVLGIPSLLIFGSIVGVYYYKSVIRKEPKYAAIR